MLMTADQQELLHSTAHGLSDWYVRKGPVRLDDAMAQTLKGVPVSIKDATTDHRVQYREQAQREGIVSMLSLPLIRRGKVRVSPLLRSTTVGCSR